MRGVCIGRHYSPLATNRPIAVYPSAWVGHTPKDGVGHCQIVFPRLHYSRYCYNERFTLGRASAGAKTHIRLPFADQLTEAATRWSFPGHVAPLFPFPLFSNCSDASGYLPDAGAVRLKKPRSRGCRCFVRLGADRFRLAVSLFFATSCLAVPLGSHI